MAKLEIKKFTEVTIFKSYNMNSNDVWGNKYEVEINPTNLTARVKNTEPFFFEKDYSRWNKLTCHGGMSDAFIVKKLYGLTVNGHRVFFSVTEPRQTQIK